ncbi:uncharacterized protein PFL1_03825 [Pseudozyma flocculosa PF-1]|uniref:Related to UGO1 - outer membrane component of the mitochondrial fusion machinery n=2 Tax=Pseudozyma flocculosa TaxID=84751 RepID=A0A5C3EVZ6_9BASI|nr:uncharacterized protein PFL1_03825 [Pseudozyma flocculosa PF-1]EPQ28522.1 hypothetical protein PFL1_03825 [Pseudozyma flocculosa PF-1]SPO36444.1 related to UGO1 - outer membrane component of the mitochondrial fusion machinery [Pseudozyma flocculosa]
MSSPGSASSASPPHPLRPYYQPPEDSVFVASAPRFSTTGTPQAASRSGAGPSASSSSSSFPRFSPNAAHANRYMSANDATPYVATSSSGMAADATANFTDMARALLVSGALQYTSTCLAMPFEVGKLLLQVQWVPRDDVWVQITQTAAATKMIEQREMQERMRRQAHEAGTHGADQGDDDDDDNAPERDVWAGDDVSPEAEEWQEERDAQNHYGGSGYMDDEELSDEHEAEAYFRDLSSRPSRPDASLHRPKRRRQRQVDHGGYVMRRSVHDDGARPEFIMPVVVRGGVWEMIKAVGRGKEGWLGLWKGSLTSFVLEIASSTIQPIISSILSLVAPSALSPLPLAYTPYPYKTLALLLTSHLATGILISPIDTIRTRLIAQSTLPAHRKYSGPYDALRKMLDEEGGWKTAYLHPNVLVPTILDFTLRPLLSLGTPLLIEQTLKLEPNTHPISYAIAELAITTASLCVTLPIETVRRRLQLQIRAPYGAAPHSAAAGADKRALTSRSLRSEKGGASTATKPASGNTAIRGLRTCVETRPVPYVGVVEAIYRILTEETSATPRRKDGSSAGGDGDGDGDGQRGDDDDDDDAAGASGATTNKDDAGAAAMAQSGVLAKTGHSSLGGLRSLYRGFGMAFGANLVVFMLTLVSGERAGEAGWAEI